MVKNSETKKRKGIYLSNLFNRVHYSINSDWILASVAESGAEKVKKAKKVETSPVAAKKRKGKTRKISIATLWILTGIQTAPDDASLAAVKKPKKSPKTPSAEESTDKPNGKSKPAKSTKAVAVVEEEVVVESEFQAEVADEDEDDDEMDDQTEVLLKGFESDGDEEDADNGEEYVASEAPKPKLTKSQKKKIQTALADAESQKPGVIYIGRIPHGFYEHEMREYFKQFGTILQLRLSRNRKTGRSKHFAFVQFESAEVAGIVSKTMDNYLMFGHLLKVKVIPNDQLSPDTFKGANKRFKKVPWNKIEGRKLKAGATEKVWDDRVVREEEKRNKKAAKLLEIGYEFEAPKLKSAKGLAQMVVTETPADVPEKKVKGKKARAAVEEAAVPEEKVKKTKKGRKSVWVVSSWALWGDSFDSDVMKSVFAC